MCDIHKNCKTLDIIQKCMVDNNEIYKLVLTITDKTKPNFLTPFHNLKKEETYVGYLALLELTTLHVKTGKDFRVDDTYKIISKYGHYVNQYYNYYEDNIEFSIYELINNACKCKPHYLITDCILSQVMEKRKDIFIKKYRIDNYVYAKETFKGIKNCVVYEEQVVKQIHPYIINTFTNGMDKIDLRNYDVTFLTEYPYAIQPYTIDYICDCFLEIKFGGCDDIHKMIHDKIMMFIIDRKNMVDNNVGKYVPYKVVDKNVIDFDKLLNSYILNTKRYPIIKKIFDNMDFNVIEDPQFHISLVLQNFLISSSKIYNGIIETFPPMYENVIFCENNMRFVRGGIHYKFPGCKLQILIDKLNSINFLECHDIHLTIHDTIIKLADSFILVDGYVVNVNLSDVYDFLDERSKIMVFRLSMGIKNMYLDENNNAVETTMVYKLKTDTNKPLVKKIFIDVSICMLCDCKKHKSPTITLTSTHKFISNHYDKFYFCSKMCKKIALKNSYTRGNNDKNNMIIKHDYNKYFWNLRHYKFKVLFLKYNWINSNFGMLDRDVMGILLGRFIDVVM